MAGRMEEVLPGVIFDGAHNLAAIREFTKSIRLQREVEGEIHPLIILFSAVADKDYSHIIQLLCRESKADAYVIAKEDNKGERRQIHLPRCSESIQTDRFIGRTMLLMHLHVH